MAITTTRRGGELIVVVPPKWCIVRGNTPSPSGAPIPCGIATGPGGASTDAAGAAASVAVTGAPVAAVVSPLPHPARTSTASTAPIAPCARRIRWLSSIEFAYPVLTDGGTVANPSDQECTL
ncbi:hypothetical protein GCM10009610_56130 [Pseudonocardia xinjiangensis]